MSRAEQSFRDAFSRLKNDSPLVLPKGSPVTQNNIAKEAGTDPTALKKARFPELVAEIQHWVSQNNQPKPVSARQLSVKERAKNRSYREHIADLTMQRDAIASQLLEADAKILELTAELDKLRRKPLPPNVKRIR
ncbi:hypothetical protein [Pseudomonas sp. Ga0074129]|uniref:hypothetical protein n=1 Tax=Pseudomonas sp. Ga0074129 TaxID=1752219 RepID=UPI000B2E719D|nr:hypothetical protein [Pseudomonas sp. Ga0074129]